MDAFYHSLTTRKLLRMLALSRTPCTLPKLEGQAGNTHLHPFFSFCLSTNRYTGLSAALGYLVGYAGAAFFSKDYNFWQVYTFLGGIFIVFSLPTIIGLREFPKYVVVRNIHYFVIYTLIFSRDTQPPLTFVTFVKSFYLDPAKYRSFYWVILTRLLEQMGHYTILPFLQYFIQDVIFRDEPAESTQHEFYSSLLLGIIVVVSIPASIVSHWSVICNI
jgi:hypothetical protein